MKDYKKILMLKLPYCTHPLLAEIDKDFRARSTFRPVPSLALATLCAFIDRYKKRHYELKAVDINIEGYTKPDESIDIEKYPVLLASFIKNNEYDVLCLSAMFVFNERWVETAVELSKQFHPEAKIIVGGGYPTLFPERCLENYEVNDVIIGEGETTLLHILNKYNNFEDPEYKKNFPFVGYGTRDENKEVLIVKRAQKQYIDLADLPVPAWHYLNIRKYFEQSGDRRLPIEATRGCPFRCTFCSTNQSWGFKVRYKPYEKLINEIIALKKRYDVEAVGFVDDNLTFSKEWTVNFLRKIVEIKLPINLSASNFSIRCLDEEIVGLLVKAGFHAFGIAVETGCSIMQKQINKNLDFEHIRRMVKIIKSYENVHLHINWMVGFPNETIEQINATFNFARELDANSNQFLVVLPYPGTQLFNEARRENLLIFTDDNLDRYDNRKCDYLKSDEWNYDQLMSKIYDINIELNFLKDLSHESEKRKEKHLVHIEEILKKLPDHVIANIIVGYMYKEKGRQDYEQYYKKAIDLLRNETLNKTFNKYLSWDNYMIEDFVMNSTTNAGN